MTEMHTDIFKGVEKTMLLPLWGRYSESIKSNGLIRDEKCVEMVEKMGLDFSGIEQRQHPLTRLAWIARAWNTDHEIGRLLDQEKESTVVCLGCGLDTSYFRLNRGPMHWVDMDLPNVIKIRKQLLGAPKSVTMIAGSVLDGGGFGKIEVKGALIVLAVGLLYYFTRPEVKKIVGHISSLSDESFLVLDYFSEQGVAVSNKMVLQYGDARMIWFANDPGELMPLHPGIRLVESYPMFKKIFPLLSKEEQAMADLSDRQSINSMAILKIG